MNKTTIITILIVIILFLSSAVIYLLYQQNRLLENSINKNSQTNNNISNEPQNGIEDKTTDSYESTDKETETSEGSYVNEEYEYSFSCPGPVEEEEPVRPNLVSKTFCTIPNPSINEFDEAIIEIYDSPLESVTEEIRTSGLTKKEGNTTISGIDVVVMNGYGGVGGSLYKEHYIFSHNGYTYQIAFNIRLTDAEPDTRSIQQIINSFTVIE